MIKFLKKLFVSILIATVSINCAVAQTTSWLPATSISIPAKSPVDFHALYLASNTPIFQINGITQPSLPPPMVWINIDLTQPPISVPTNAVAVGLTGELIITQGTSGGDTGVAISFEAPGAGINAGRYVMHAAAEGVGGGARTDGTAIVPCINGHIWMAWLRGNGSEWPANPIAPYPVGAAYGFNINVQAIYLP